MIDRVLRRPSAALVISRLISFACSLVSAVVLARLLRPQGYGVYAGALSVVALVTMLGPLGVDQVLLAGRTGVVAAQQALTRVAVLSSTVVVLAALLWPGVGSGERLAIALLGASAVANQLRCVWYAEPQRRLDFASRARRELLVVVELTSATVLAAVVSRSPVVTAGVTMLASALLCIPTLRWSLARRQGHVGGDAGDHGWPVVLRAGWPFAASSAAYTGYVQMGGALLVSLGAALDVAYYRAAWTFFLAAVMVPVVLNNDILRPRIYALGPNGRLGPLLRRFLALNVVASAIYAVVLLAAGPVILPLVFGEAYRPAVHLLPWLAVLVPVNFMSSCLTNTLIGLRRVRRAVGNQIGMLITCALASFLLIPSGGARGAVQALVVAELAGLVSVAVLLWVVLRRRQAATATATSRLPS